MALLRCDFCGEPFSDHIEHWTKGNLVFCSKNCLDSYVEKHSVCCEECGGQVLKSSSIYRDGHYFCSEICYDKWQFKQWQKNEEKEAHELVAQTTVTAENNKTETVQDTPQEVAMTDTQDADAHAVVLTESDLPITRPENYRYTPEEIALMKKQANEAYIKWVELELEIAKFNLEHTAQNQ